MKKLLFTFVSLFFTMMITVISTGSPEYNYEEVVHGHLDSHPLKLPMIRPVPIPVGCQKALLELKCCSDQIHEIFLGKKLDHVTDKCCKAVKEFELSCMHPTIVPHVVIPHLLKEHCAKVAVKPNPIGFEPNDPDPVPMTPDYADPIVSEGPPPPSPVRITTAPPPPVRRTAPPLVRGVPVLVADPPPPPARSAPIAAAPPPPPTTTRSVPSPVTTSPIIDALPPSPAPTPSPAPAPSPSDLYAWLIVK